MFAKHLIYDELLKTMFRAALQLRVCCVFIVIVVVVASFLTSKTP